MRELAGKLSSLDPEAEASVRVIEFFDRLVDGKVGVESMLKGAAVMCGATVGYRSQSRDYRYDAEGKALPASYPHAWPSVAFGEQHVVWLEREGAPHANDAMVLERLAISLSIQSLRLDSHAPTRRAVEILLTDEASDAEREQALARLPLPAMTPIYAIATLPSTSFDKSQSLPHAIISTRFGMVRAMLSVDRRFSIERAGIGLAADHFTKLRDSWRSALIALRLTDFEHPIIAADDLGVLLRLAEADDRASIPHPDLMRINRALDADWTLPMLQSVAAGVSQRSLAMQGGVHHSTMEARLRKLTSLLEFDPLTHSGMTRLGTALFSYRLANSRFDVPTHTATPNT